MNDRKDQALAAFVALNNLGRFVDAVACEEYEDNLDTLVSVAFGRLAAFFGQMEGDEVAEHLNAVGRHFAARANRGGQ